MQFAVFAPTYLSEHSLTDSFQRNLNNAFAYDLVPSTSVITAALKAARRVNDYPTAVRIFEGESNTPKNNQTISSHGQTRKLHHVVMFAESK